MLLNGVSFIFSFFEIIRGHFSFSNQNFIPHVFFCPLKFVGHSVFKSYCMSEAVTLKLEDSGSQLLVGFI